MVLVHLLDAIRNMLLEPRMKRSLNLAQRRLGVVAHFMPYLVREEDMHDTTQVSDDVGDILECLISRLDERLGIDPAMTIELLLVQVPGLVLLAHVLQRLPTGPRQKLVVLLLLRDLLQLEKGHDGWDHGIDPVTLELDVNLLTRREESLVVTHDQLLLALTMCCQRPHQLLVELPVSGRKVELCSTDAHGFQFIIAQGLEDLDCIWVASTRLADERVVGVRLLGHEVLDDLNPDGEAEHDAVEHIRHEHHGRAVHGIVAHFPQHREACQESPTLFPVAGQFRTHHLGIHGFDVLLLCLVEVPRIVQCLLLLVASGRQLCVTLTLQAFGLSCRLVQVRLVEGLRFVGSFLFLLPCRSIAVLPGSNATDDLRARAGKLAIGALLALLRFRLQLQPLRLAFGLVLGEVLLGVGGVLLERRLRLALDDAELADLEVGFGRRVITVPLDGQLAECVLAHLVLRVDLGLRDLDADLVVEPREFEGDGRHEGEAEHDEVATHVGEASLLATLGREVGDQVAAVHVQVQPGVAEGQAHGDGPGEGVGEGDGEREQLDQALHQHHTAAPLERRSRAGGEQGRPIVIEPKQSKYHESPLFRLRSYRCPVARGDRSEPVSVLWFCLL